MKMKKKKVMNLQVGRIQELGREICTRRLCKRDLQKRKKKTTEDGAVAMIWW